MIQKRFVPGRKTGLFLLFVCMLFSATGALAADVIISDQGCIIIDTNKNNVPDKNDYRWEVNYTPRASTNYNGMVWQTTDDSDKSVQRMFYLDVKNIGGPIVVDEISNPWVAQPTRTTVTVTREGTGNTTGYNTVEFAESGATFCKLNLYDTTGDLIADTIQGYGDGTGSPRICVDYALAATAVESYGGIDYLMLDLSNIASLNPVLKGWGTTKSFSKVFIPVVNPGGTDVPYVTVKSGGTTWGGTGARITPAQPAPTPIPCSPGIPTVDEYGAALIMLLLLVGGIWVMRKRGFGGKMAV